LEAGAVTPKPQSTRGRSTKAIDIIKVGGTADDGDDFEDLGRVSDTLLSALSLQPGQFTRT
jgi:hypothetical protein